MLKPITVFLNIKANKEIIKVLMYDGPGIFGVKIIFIISFCKTVDLRYKSCHPNNSAPVLDPVSRDLNAKFRRSIFVHCPQHRN